MKDLRDRVVVITGAGSGIGRATALALAREGARVHLVDIDPERARAVEEECRAAGAEATAHVVDCTDSAAMVALAEAVHAAHGRTDILVSNAGVCVSGPVESLSLADWKWIVDVNLWGVIHGVHAFLPRMIESGGGHIVNVGSIAGLVGMPRVVPYCATKFAVVGLSEALGLELVKHNVRVTTVCPGPTRTNVLKSGRIDLPSKFRGTLEGLLARYAKKPEDVADEIVSAIRSDRSMVMTSPGFMPLWILKRSSERLFDLVVRFITARALKAYDRS